MKLIGITSSAGVEHDVFMINKPYAYAFNRPGVTPVVLPNFQIPNRDFLTREAFMAAHREEVDGIAVHLDALCLSGGSDIHPVSFGEQNYKSEHCDTERDFTELALIDAFVRANKPILGICRGHQIAGLYFGLKGFRQDISSLPDNHNNNEFEMKSRQEPAHIVYLLGEFRDYLRKKTGRADLISTFWNSFHHQGFVFHDKIPKRVDVGVMNEAAQAYERANGVKIIARTSFIIEGIEKPEAKYVSFQCHPEEYGPTGLLIQYWLDRYVLV